MKKSTIEAIEDFNKALRSFCAVVKKEVKKDYKKIFKKQS